MKRSEINVLMQDAVEFFREHNFHLPPFAFWTVQDWAIKRFEVSQIVQNDLGWDITDYGLDDFKKYGLLLFTLRNGNMGDWDAGVGTPYAEKVMIAEVDQVHQMHFHWKKVEDIINRNGGTLLIQLYNSTEDEQLSQSEVRVIVDGVLRRVPAGGTIKLKPGESITLPTLTYHKFWAEGERVMMGEVSTINDDKIDNCFYQPIGTGRFSEIEEDEPPFYLLFTDYKKYWNPERI